MTESIWRSIFEQFAERGTRNERLMARMLLMTMRLPGADGIVDNFALDVLEEK